jgi:hypothetical protein
MTTTTTSRAAVLAALEMTAQRLEYRITQRRTPRPPWLRTARLNLLRVRYEQFMIERGEGEECATR